MAGALGAPMGGVPRPALLVVHAAGVAVEAAEVQLLLPRGPLLARGQVLGSPADRQLLRSQLLLLLRGQLPLELRPCSQSQRRQALRIPATSTHTQIRTNVLGNSAACSEWLEGAQRSTDNLIHCS